MKPSFNRFPRKRNKKPSLPLSGSYVVTLVSAAVGCGWNLIYALFNLAMAWIAHSAWLLTLGICYIVLGSMRASALAYHGNTAGEARTLLRHNGYVMCVLAVLTSCVIFFTISSGERNGSGTILMIAHAAFTFTLTGMAVRNVIRAQTSNNAQLILLRDVSLAAAVFSMFSLERSMLATFGSGEASYMLRIDAFSGLGVFAVILWIGIRLLRLGRMRV